jgi:hypothetical protein
VSFEKAGSKEIEGHSKAEVWRISASKTRKGFSECDVVASTHVVSVYGRAQTAEVARGGRRWCVSLDVPLCRDLMIGASLSRYFEQVVYVP